jgi:hypothetical protein
MQLGTQKRKRTVRKRLWIIAALAAIVGVASLVTFHQINAFGVVVFAAPYAAAVGITALAGQRHTGAAVISMVGAVVMSGLSWWEVAHRQTDGFEYEFNNDLQFSCCCGVNWFVLMLVAAIVLLLTKPATDPDARMRKISENEPEA